MNKDFEDYTELSKLSQKFFELMIDLNDRIYLLSLFLNDENSLITSDETVLQTMHKKAEEGFEVCKELDLINDDFQEMIKEAKNRCSR